MAASPRGPFWESASAPGPLAGYEFRKPNHSDEHGSDEFKIRQLVGQSLVEDPELWHVDGNAIRLCLRSSGEYAQLEFVFLRVAWPPAKCHLSLIHAEADVFRSEWTAERIEERLVKVCQDLGDLLLNFNGTGKHLRIPPFTRCRTFEERRVLVDMHPECWLRNRLVQILDDVLMMYSCLKRRGGCSHMSIDAVCACVGW